MKKARIITATIALMLLITVTGACYLTGYTVFQHTLGGASRENIETETAAFLYSVGFNRRNFERNHSITPVEIQGKRGAIPADLIAGGTKGVVIMVHGEGVSSAAVYPIAWVFLDMGYDVLAYNGGSSNMGATGYLESRDLIDCIRWAEAQEKGEIILWGVSWGAAAVGIAAGDSYVREMVKAVILDSPISDLRSMAAQALAENDSSIPDDFLLTMGNVMTRLRLGFWYEDADVRRHGANIGIPVLILTSRADTVAPFTMGDEIYNAIPHESKRIITVLYSPHGEIYYNDPEAYATNIREFLTSHF